MSAAAVAVSAAPKRVTYTTTTRRNPTTMAVPPLPTLMPVSLFLTHRVLPCALFPYAKYHPVKMHCPSRSRKRANNGGGRWKEYERRQQGWEWHPEGPRTR